MNKDDRLLERVKQGDADAFSEIVLEHQGHLRAYLGRYVRDSQTRDDLAQDAFIRAYRNLGSFRRSSSFRVWLFGIARNVALQCLQKQARTVICEPAALEDVVNAGNVGECEGNAELEQERREREISALMACLELLPRRHSELVRAFYYERQNSRELAKKEGTAATTVRIRLMRIRKALRDCVETRTSREEACA